MSECSRLPFITALAVEEGMVEPKDLNICLLSGKKFVVMVYESHNSSSVIWLICFCKPLRLRMTYTYACYLMIHKLPVLWKVISHRSSAFLQS